jgi:hypothetical protein
MSLSEILDRVQPWCPGWERTTGRKNLLALAQQCLDKIYAVDHDSLIFRPGNTGGNTGLPPYLITTAGTFKYSLDAAHLSCGGAIYHESSGNTVQFIPRKVHRVLVESTWTGIYDYYPQGPLIYLPNSWRTFYQEVVSTTSAMTANSGTYIPPTLTFTRDPGTGSTKFLIEFFIAPKRLTSDSDEIPLTIQHEQDMEDYIRGRVQELESGSPSPMMNKFMQSSLPEIRNEILSTATIQRTSTPPNYV